MVVPDERARRLPSNVQIGNGTDDGDFLEPESFVEGPVISPFGHAHAHADIDQAIGEGAKPIGASHHLGEEAGDHHLAVG